MRIRDLHVSKVRRSNGKWSLYVMPTHFMSSLIEIEFRGGKYLIPRETDAYLTHLYGADWQTPKRTVRQKEYLNPEFKTEGLI